MYIYDEFYLILENEYFHMLILLFMCYRNSIIKQFLKISSGDR